MGPKMKKSRLPGENAKKKPRLKGRHRPGQIGPKKRVAEEKTAQKQREKKLILIRETLDERSQPKYDKGIGGTPRQERGGETKKLVLHHNE